MVLKTSKGRLTEAGVMQIHVFRDAWLPTREKKMPAHTLEWVAKACEVSLVTVFAVCSGKSHPDLHPSKHLFWETLARYEAA